MLSSLVLRIGIHSGAERAKQEEKETKENGQNGIKVIISLKQTVSKLTLPLDETHAEVEGRRQRSLPVFLLIMVFQRIVFFPAPV